MQRPLTEFIGTFFLVLSIGLSVLQGSPYAPLAIGATLMVMVYMGGHVSGAHYNPAVSVALLIRGVMPSKDFVPYVTAQILGALTAAVTVNLITGQTFAPAPNAAATTTAALLVEILFTFALTLVVLNVATSKKTHGNQYYGLAIGATVTGGAYVGGGISGGAFNPAVGIGPTVVNAALSGGGWSALWLYLVGPIAGALLAVFVFRIQEAE